METADTNLIARIRKNFSLLLFLVTAAIPLVLWWLLILLVSFSGTLFSDPKQVGMSIFMVFFFPLIAAPIISGLAILISRLLNLPNIGCLVIVVLGFIIPLVAFGLVLVANSIARKLYTGDIANIPEVMPKSTKSVPVAAPAVSGEPSEKLAKLKDMLDKGLISQQDYETKKADVLAKM